jgi:hypothetical protein
MGANCQATARHSSGPRVTTKGCSHNLHSEERRFSVVQTRQDDSMANKSEMHRAAERQPRKTRKQGQDFFRNPFACFACFAVPDLGLHFDLIMRLSRGH